MKNKPLFIHRFLLFQALLLALAFFPGGSGSPAWARADGGNGFSFFASDLTAEADKEAIAPGTPLDEGGLGRIVTFGSVVKRWKEEKGVTSVEVGKALSSGLTFTVSGAAEASVVVSSNGGDNDSSVGLMDESGAIIRDSEGIRTVHGTGKQTLTYILAAGTYSVVSPPDEVNRRGARVYSLSVTEKASSGEERAWEFRYFGVSTGGDRNVLLSAGKGIEADVSLGSALFNEDGTVQKKGGKFVADSPADGGSYYFTVIDPTTTNFCLEADVTVDALNPAPDGQEGFALMARDSLGVQGAPGSWMANLVSVGAAKLPYGGVNTSPESACAVGIRAYSGIRTPEASDENSISATRYSWGTADGNANRIRAGQTCRLKLEKTDYAYIASQYDPETGALIGQYTWYIPAKDSNAQTVSDSSELDDPLTWQEGHAAYIALAAARGLNATFSNIRFSTSPWNPGGWHPQPTEYIDLEASIGSGETAAGGSYTLLFRANADGNADIYKNDVLLAENIPAAADTWCSLSVDLPEEKAVIRVEFKPDEDFAFSAFEKLSDTGPVSLTVTVTQRALGRDGIIHVRPDGRSTNAGTGPRDAVDLQTALDYVSPGQTILLESAVYDLSGRELTVPRGRSGTADAPIAVTTADGRFAVLDFGGTGRGFRLWGDWWHLSMLNVTRTSDGLPGMQLAGSHCLIERMNFYGNGTTGLQVSGSSRDLRALWPSFNTIKNCTSMNNADKALEDADGFAAKLSTGEGNVFDGCIAAYNADDGWDLFAKIVPGQIGAVTVKNCLAFKNGFLRVKDGFSAGEFVLADVTCDENGTLVFGDSLEMEAGNGNGFKLGGSNLPGGHTLFNSIAYENKAKGIDSNSCPDIKVERCTSFNNGSHNIALYTGSASAATGFSAKGVLSFRSGGSTGPGEKLDPQKQADSAVLGQTNYYWDAGALRSVNSLGAAVSDDWFLSLDPSVFPEREADGSINMHGLLLLKEAARCEAGAGAGGLAWGQRESTIWVVGDSTASAFSDAYYLPREGYGEALSRYFNAAVYNLARSGASSKDYTGMEQYRVLLEGNDTVPALGTAGTDQFLLIAFGHNDEKTEEARFTDPNGDYLTEGSFANSIYVHYILPAVQRGVIPVICTPIARLTAENTPESYAGSAGHITEDVTVGGRTWPGGNYSRALLDMVRQLQGLGMEIEFVDLTAATIDKNIALGQDACRLHAYTGAAFAPDGVTLVPTGLDRTHTSHYGALMNAWLVSRLSADTAPRLHAFSLDREEPLYEASFAASVNPGYVVPDYQVPTAEQMDSVPWPQFTDAGGRLWRGTVFGDVGGESKINGENFTAALSESGDEITLSAANNCGKISSGSDGLLFYYIQLPAGTCFTLTARARILRFFANNQVSFGLMVRDDLYLDRSVSDTLGDYAAAGTRNQGAVVNFGRKSGVLIGDAPSAAVSLAEGTETELKLTGTRDGFTLTFGSDVSSAGFDYPLTNVDPDHIYVGFYVVRNAAVAFSGISLEIME